MISRLRLILACCVGTLLAACATTPPGVVANAEAERAMGAQTTPGFLQANGGVYEEARLQAYLDGLVARLSAGTVIPAGFSPIRIGVLDTGAPLAYTVPGGQIYLSRGLIAMSNDEAELAAVIAHEIGHVTARHIAERRAATERLILDVARKERGTQSGSRNRRIAIITQKVQERLGELDSFSQEQELDADRSSAAILRQTGYDPGSLGRVLERIDAWQSWRLASAGIDALEADEYNGYPATDVRIAAFGPIPDTPVDAAGQARLMAVIDGMPAEDTYQGGLIRNGRYRNLDRGVSFDMPDGFLPFHGERTRLASDDAALEFQIIEAGNATLDEAQAVFAERDLPIEGVRRSVINGFPAMIGSVPADKIPDNIGARLVVLDIGDAFLVMGLVAEAQRMAEMVPVLEGVTASIRQDDASAALSRHRYRTRRAQAGDSIAAIARRGGLGEGGQRRLRLLNGLAPGAEPEPGSWIKVIE